MPRGDGTGPMGQGSMTGRAAGFCAGFSTPGFASPASRMGMGFRRGAGSGRGRGQGGGFGRIQTSAQPFPQRRQPQQMPAQPASPAAQQPQIQAQPQQVAPQTTNPVASQPQTSVQPSRDQRIQMLGDQLATLENQLNQIRNAISQLQG